MPRGISLCSSTQSHFNLDVLFWVQLYANQCRKERRLAALLLRWHRRAAERAEDLMSSINALEGEIAALLLQEVSSTHLHVRRVVQQLGEQDGSPSNVLDLSARLFTF